jgi:predicted nuclease of predicted toxin-antitoxin system
MTELLAKVYLDEDVSVEVAKLLHAGQCDALTTAEAKRLGASDRDQLEFSTSDGRVLVTHNRRDFESLARIRFETRISHAGLIIAVRRPPRSIADRILHILNQFSSDEMVDRIVYI